MDAQIRAADAAEKQVTAAWATFFLSFFATCLIGWTLWETRKTVKAAADSVNVAARATEATVEANRLSREAFIVDQRPWVAVTRYEPDHPLIWDSAGIYTRFCIFLENTGKTPALKIEVNVRCCILRNIYTLESKQIEFADKIRKEGTSLNMSLFPGQKNSSVVIAYFDNNDIGKHLLNLGMKSGEFNIAVLGCVNYYSAFERQNPQTGFIFTIGNNFLWDERVHQPRFYESIPQDKLRLHPWPFSGRTD